MSARQWLRRRLAAWAYPEIARLDQALADEQQQRTRAQEACAGLLSRYGRAQAQLGDARTVNARLLAELRRRAPFSLVDEEHERAVRHAEAEQTGGR